MPTNLDLILSNEQNKAYLAQILSEYCIDAKEHVINYDRLRYPCEGCQFNNGNCSTHHTECDDAIEKWLRKEVEEE